MPHELQSAELQKLLRDLLQQAPAADWVQDMIDHYRQTGSYRPEDLRRLLGDLTRHVEIGPDASLSAFYSIARPGSS